MTRAQEHFISNFTTDQFKKVVCLHCFSFGKFEQYRGHHKLRQNIDFIVLFITQIWAVISQQGNKINNWDKCQQKAIKMENEFDLYFLILNL